MLTVPEEQGTSKLHEQAILTLLIPTPDSVSSLLPAKPLDSWRVPYDQITLEEQT